MTKYVTVSPFCLNTGSNYLGKLALEVGIETRARLGASTRTGVILRGHFLENE